MNLRSILFACLAANGAPAVFDVTEFGECVECGVADECEVGECVSDTGRRGLRFGISTSGCCRGA